LKKQQNVEKLSDFLIKNTSLETAQYNPRFEGETSS